MTENEKYEICQAYKNRALKSKEMVKTLAELYDCDKKEIYAVLHEGGFLGGTATYRCVKSGLLPQGTDGYYTDGDEEPKEAPEVVEKKVEETREEVRKEVEKVKYEPPKILVITDYKQLLNEYKELRAALDKKAAELVAIENEIRKVLDGEDDG